MYVDEHAAHINGKTYTRYLIRESYRDKGKIKHRTIANISKCSPEEIGAIKLALKYKGEYANAMFDRQDIHMKQGLSVGAVYVLKQVADRLGITQALGSTENAKQALWMALSRLISAGSRLSNVRLAERHAAVDVIGMDAFNEDDLYNTLDWIERKQESIESRLYKSRYTGKIPNLFLYDVTSSYMEGKKNELSDWGYAIEKKNGKKQIIIGLLTDAEGWPVSVEVFYGDTSDVKTFVSQIKKLANRFGCERVTMVGDRGMIKTKEIEELREENYYYITGITKPQIESLMKQGVIQMKLFSEELCEVENGGIRYILKRNPVRAAEIKENRESKIVKLKKIAEESNKNLREHVKAKVETVEKQINKQIDKLNLKKYVKVEVTEREVKIEIEEEEMKRESMLDGCYVLKTNVPKEGGVDMKTIRDRYRDLIHVEDAFRTVKTGSGMIEVRPAYVRKAARTRGHVFVVALSYMIEKELREAWRDINVRIKEGVEELTMINAIEMEVKGIKYNQIPEPRELGIKLIKALGLSMPVAIENKGITIATRKKINNKSKI